ncbi:hypothetical protein DPMN_084598 [Dreissena polymorpha]|uniref:Uncharacterized protein n=1 Tax=Dreissena polymorpha TaxID=45954 RepID=A0A9D3YDF0_DREPO|nr:hypothetical protein DPMN_084598 [Dreissena polymorpha]
MVVIGGIGLSLLAGIQITEMMLTGKICNWGKVATSKIFVTGRIPKLVIFQKVNQLLPHILTMQLQ